MKELLSRVDYTVTYLLHTLLSKLMLISGKVTMIIICGVNSNVMLIPLISASVYYYGASFSAAVAEMLVQSSLEDLYLLPALPVDKWGSGRVKGLMARGGITVDIQWQEGDLRQVHLRSNYNAPVILGRKLHYKGLMVPIKIEQGRVHAFDGELRQLSSL